MNRESSTLPVSFRQVFSEVLSEGEALGLESDVLFSLLLQPLVSDHFNDAQQKCHQRMDHLRAACRRNATRIMRLLMKVSLLLLVDFLRRYREAETPYQKTRSRLVLCGDDSLLVHAEESEQVDVVNLWSTLYKRYRKSHDLILLGVTVGPKRGHFFFPLWVELWRQPATRKQTRPQRMASALYRLQEALLDYGLSLEGIDFATDNGYLSPVVAKAVKACKLLMTTKLKSNQEVTFLSGEETTITQIREQMMETHPIRHDPRAGKQAYYWRTEVIHPYLGEGTLVIQRRKLRSGGFQYHSHFSQHRDAKAITVLQIAARRWPLEVFFRESKQQLSLGHLSYRKWSSLRGHVAIRGLLYFIFALLRRKLKWKRSKKTIGALKRRFSEAFMTLFTRLVERKEA